jgi:predicted phosphodiesterase
MRAAVFSDVHGSLPALEAVLDAAADADVDQLWVVGDLVAHGPHPAETVRRLSDLAETRDVVVVRGNTDRYVVNGEVSPLLTALDPAKYADKARMVADARASFDWTLQAVDWAGCLDWLAGLPMEARLTLPDGSLTLLVHASPGHDDGAGLHPEMTEYELRAAGVPDAGAALIFVGHTHVPMDRSHDGVRVVNVGSVSVPVTADPRAMWTLLSADEHGYHLEHRREEYDLEVVLSDLYRVGHPSAAWLEAKIRGR